MKNRRALVFLATCSLLGATIVYASYSWPAAGLSSPSTFEAEWDYDNGNHTVAVKIERGGYNASTGTVSVSAKVEVDEPNAIRGIWVETCEDTSGNNNIEASEWATRSTGSVTNNVGSTVATVPAFDIDVKYDGYQLRWEWADGGVASEQVLAPGLTAD